MYICVLPTSTSTQQEHAVPAEGREGAGAPGTEVTDNCKLPYRRIASDLHC